jgi:hypothetical protein
MVFVSGLGHAGWRCLGLRHARITQRVDEFAPALYAPKASADAASGRPYNGTLRDREIGSPVLNEFREVTLLARAVIYTRLTH